MSSEQSDPKQEGAFFSSEAKRSKFAAPLQLLRRVSSHALLDMEDDDDISTPKQIDLSRGSVDLSYTVGQSCSQGKRSYMEDRILEADLTNEAQFKGCHRALLLGVFDGHAGPEAAELLKSQFQMQLLTSIESTSNYGEALKHALLECERVLLEAHCTSGSTALVALMVDGMLHVANVGDCRAVVSDEGEARPLTWDHNPIANQLERARIVATGATLSADGYVRLDIEHDDAEDRGVGQAPDAPRLCCSDIALSRALGGVQIKQLQLQRQHRSAQQLHQIGPGRSNSLPVGVEVAGDRENSDRRREGSTSGSAVGILSWSNSPRGLPPRGPSSPQGPRLPAHASMSGPQALTRPLSSSHHSSNHRSHYATHNHLEESPDVECVAHQNFHLAATPTRLSPPVSTSIPISKAPPRPIEVGIAASGADGLLMQSSSSKGEESASGKIRRHSEGCPGTSPPDHHHDALLNSVTASFSDQQANDTNRLESSSGHVVYESASAPSYAQAPDLLLSSINSGAVIADPELFQYSIHQGSEFLIMASDGLWDKVTNAEAVRCVRRWMMSDSVQQASEKLVSTALQLGSIDNVSVLLLRFSGRPLPSLRSSNSNSVLFRTRSGAIENRTLAMTGGSECRTSQPQVG